MVDRGDLASHGKILNILWLLGYRPDKVVQDFVHPQYHYDSHYDFTCYRCIQDGSCLAIAQAFLFRFFLFTLRPGSCTPNVHAREICDSASAPLRSASLVPNAPNQITNRMPLRLQIELPDLGASCWAAFM